MPGDVVDYLTDGANWSGPTGIGTFLVQQLLLTVTALALAIIIGLPFALYAGHRRRGGFLAINVSNVGRAVPVFAVLLVLSLGPIGSDFVSALASALQDAAHQVTSLGADLARAADTAAQTAGSYVDTERRSIATLGG